MEQPSNVLKKLYILFQKERSNSYYFGCSQSYYFYQIHIYLYQVPKDKQNGTSIKHGE